MFKILLNNKIDKVKIVLHKNIDKNVLLDIIDYFSANNIEIVDDTSQADVILSFGGDGTMLVAAQETLIKNIPIISINMGTLGYLAEIYIDDLVETIEDYKQGKYIIDERYFLEIDLNGEKFYAMNELVVAKGGLLANLIEVSLFQENYFVNQYRADGLIISTPTGSTAYSMSAGGSIVHPDLNAVIITPLAPHSLTNRPIVVSGNKELILQVYSRDNDSHINIDGKKVIKVNSDDNIKVIMSDKKVKIVRSGKKNYYSILREKLKWGESVLNNKKYK